MKQIRVLVLCVLWEGGWRGWERRAEFVQALLSLLPSIIRYYSPGTNHIITPTGLCRFLNIRLPNIALYCTYSACCPSINIKVNETPKVRLMLDFFLKPPKSVEFSPISIVDKYKQGTIFAVESCWH